MEMLNLMPDYIGKGIIQLLIISLCGVIVAWITIYVFGRRSEINAVEGTLLKRKLDIYEELSGKLEALKSMVLIPADIHEAAMQELREIGVAFNPINSDQLFCIFDSPKTLTEEFLSIDKYIATKRMYFDNDVLIQTLRFQNYFACLRRLLVVFEEPFVDQHLSLDGKEVASVERLLTMELGMMLQNELTDQMDKVVNTMKNSFKNLTFDHRDEIEYNYDFFNSLDGPIMSELCHTILFEKREEIMSVVTNAAALGMAAYKESDKQQKK